MQVLYKRHVISGKPKRQSQYIVDDARLVVQNTRSAQTPA